MQGFFIHYPEKKNRYKMVETARYLIGSAGSSGFGSKSTAEEVTNASPDLRSITAIITGATSGIGAETARVLAKRGARLLIPARSLKAAQEVKARINGEFPESEIIVLPLDLSSLSSVRSFVSRFLSLQLPLNLLINNAGKFSHNYALSEDGIEMTFATNYLGHFLLTKLLMEKMADTARITGIQGRIINISSGIHTWFTGDVLRYLDFVTRKKIPYDATQTYALSKLANVLHTAELAAKLEEMGANVTANCVHPGIVRTRLTREREGFLTDLAFFITSKVLKTIPQAAATTCYVAASSDLVGVTGKYFSDCNLSAPSKAAENRKEAARLWSASEEMAAMNLRSPEIAEAI
ncbi:short-chain dehydrogenase TIC 32, chloroplastic-like [Phalaenopsis equestris]|uniref:short-chain dehydrogenase TIC 32, chloroplastic-like n=1 Tax=Phalaenopsis equestris TaxID=78828 RepID=UPI0009E2CFF7|nr:short-chain dehydrogenase TIC 32, chloroplastic-like [Phalaenopsis equestris]